MKNSIVVVGVVAVIVVVEAVVVIKATVCAGAVITLLVDVLAADVWADVVVINVGVIALDMSVDVNTNVLSGVMTALDSEPFKEFGC